MKRTILVILMLVMVTIPCFAQEIEPDGMFSIEGTRWRVCEINIILSFKFGPSFDVECYEMGFCQGAVYRCNENSCGLFSPYQSYIDSPVLSGFNSIFPFELYVMQPTAGIGLSMGFYCWKGSCVFTNGIMFKIDDNWKPLMTISISPDEGEKGTTVTDVNIHGTNTTFQNNPTVEISFNPPDGLTVSNINVISNTEIEFDLEIAVDAPTGARSVTVTYDNGKQSVSRGGYAFRVNERTN